MELICEKVAAGEASLVDAMEEVQRRIAAQRALLPEETAAVRPTERDAIDAAWEPVPTSTPVDPPPPSPQERAAERYRATREAQERHTPPLTREQLIRMQEESLEQRQRTRCITESEE